jgi:hypothetical protein
MMTAKVLTLLTDQDPTVNAQGRELFLSLLEAEDTDILNLFQDAWLHENGRLTESLPWCDPLLDAFFGHPSIQIHREGRFRPEDVQALDLSTLACDEGRLKSLSWLRHLPNLKRLDLSCQALTEEMIDNLCALEKLEWINTFGCPYPWAQHGKFSALPSADTGLPRGAGRFFQCSSSNPDELQLRDYRIGSVSFQVIKRGRIHRIYFLAEGYSGGGNQGENQVRLDFLPDGSVMAYRTYWYDGETYETVCQVFPDRAQREEQEVPALDQQIFGTLRDHMEEFRSHDEEWDRYRPTSALLTRLENGVYRDGFAASNPLVFGLSRFVIGLNTYWEEPGDVPTLLDAEAPPFGWGAFGEETEAPIFLSNQAPKNKDV